MIQLLDATPPETPFPPLDKAIDEPNGLLAIGGDLTPTRLLNAYRQGVFPWYSSAQPILWWSPDPRLVLYPGRLHVSRSLRKSLRKPFEVSLDRDFPGVIRACAAPRQDEDDPGTWITSEMMAAYIRLHRLGHAHSVEVWLEGELVGGLYGVAIGAVFFGESMFSRRRDASKIALVHLTRQLADWGYRLIDCQVYSEHLVSLGAEEIPRKAFAHLLNQYCPMQTTAPRQWRHVMEGPND